MGVGAGIESCLKGPTDGIDARAVGHVDFAHEEMETKSTQKTTLKPSEAFEFTITYTTSAEPDRAGPMADMFIMPSGTIQLTTVYEVGWEEATCTLSGADTKASKILLYLSGFYYISAADVEARVLPQLEGLVWEENCRDCTERCETQCCPAARKNTARAKALTRSTSTAMRHVLVRILPRLLPVPVSDLS